MTSYVYGSRWTYKDFLQAKEFDNSIKLAIENQTLKQIASDRELARDGARLYREASAANTDRIVVSNVESTNRILVGQAEAANQITGAVADHARLTAEGFTLIHYDLERAVRAVGEAGEAIERQTALLDWRLSEVVGGLGKIDTSLDTLIKLSRTPSQTWAYEQFEIARESFNRGLFSEAKNALDHAVNGYGSHTGYPLEPRFHYLLGTIYLTATGEGTENIVDLAASEKAFLRSAQVAGKQDVEMASRAYCAAGYAAYCQGGIEGARKHLDLAKSLDPRNAEAFFLSGKVYAHAGLAEAMVGDLATAIDSNRRYATRAAADEVYQRYPDHCSRARNDFRKRVEEAVTNLLSIASVEKERIRQAISDVAGPTSAQSDELEKAVALLDSAVAEAKERMQSGTLFGITEAQVPANRLQGALVTMKGAAQSCLSPLIRSARRLPKQINVQARRPPLLMPPAYIAVPSRISSASPDLWG